MHFANIFAAEVRAGQVAGISFDFWEREVTQGCELVLLPASGWGKSTEKNTEAQGHLQKLKGFLFSYIHFDFWLAKESIQFDGLNVTN